MKLLEVAPSKGLETLCFRIVGSHFPLAITTAASEKVDKEKIIRESLFNFGIKLIPLINRRWGEATPKWTPWTRSVDWIF